MQSAWEDHYKSHNYFHLEPHEALANFVAECNKRGFIKVLDLGCGAGQDLLYLAEHGFEVTGVDFSPAAAANAEDLLQSKGLAGKVFVEDLFDKITSFASGEFPAITAINSLEYTNPAMFSSTVAQTAKILAPKGLFLLVVASEQTPVNLKVDEQLFFSEEMLTRELGSRFNFLDLYQDEHECYVALLEKIDHDHKH